MPDFATLKELLDHHKFPFVLRSDQVEDTENLYGFDRIGLFNEVGTGKTATATAIALAWDTPCNTVLMPPILLKQWYLWLKSLNDIGDVLVYRGSPAERKSFDLRRYRWILMTIQIFKNDYQHLVKQLGTVERALIVDEGHCIKNVASANHKAVRDFSAGHKLQILTGTPISTPGDTYGYVKLKTPSVYRSQAQFENLHVEERDFFGNVTKWMNLEQMNRNLMLQSTRRLAKEVLKLGMPNYIPIEYDLDPEHKALYDQLADEQLLLLPDGGKIDATSAGRLYNALQQIVCNWDHFSGDPKCKSKAFDVVDLVAEEIDVVNPQSSKLIVFTYYVMTSRAMVKHLEKLGAVACYSEISAKQQAANIERFLTDPTCRILVAQPGSAGVGWNAQHVCWEVLCIEEPMSPWQFTQAVGRVDRDGQLHVPNIRLGIASGTIQHRLHANLLNKDALANKVQGGFMDLREAIHGR